MIPFIEMKIADVIRTIEDMDREDYRRYANAYELGSIDGYIQAAELELVTLNQILDKLKETNDTV